MKCPHCNTTLDEDQFHVLKCPLCRYYFYTYNIKGTEFLVRWIDKNSAVTKKLWLYGPIDTLTDNEITSRFGAVFGGCVKRMNGRANVSIYVD